MAQINFPALPAVGDLFSVPGTGVTYRWNGLVWLTQAGPGGGTGDFFANITAAGWPNVATTPTSLTVTTGNSGGWFNVGTGRFTPPAGRYYLFAGGYTGNTTVPVGVALTLRKNGTVINGSSQYSAAANGLAQTGVADTLDANGADWFDIQISASTTTNMSGSLWFGAFPLTGMQGPMGPSGSMLINGTGAPTGLSAAKGTLYINTTATTTTTRLYVNTDGGTTWANFTASA